MGISCTEHRELQNVFNYRLKLDFDLHAKYMSYTSQG